MNSICRRLDRLAAAIDPTGRVIVIRAAAGQDIGPVLAPLDPQPGDLVVRRLSFGATPGPARLVAVHAAAR